MCCILGLMVLVTENTCFLIMFRKSFGVCNINKENVWIFSNLLSYGRKYVRITFIV
jgi:hypothetical protein